MAEMTYDRAAQIVCSIAIADAREITEVDPKVMVALCVIEARRIEADFYSVERARELMRNG